LNPLGTKTVDSSKSTSRAAVRFAIDMVLHSYSAVLFARSRWMGLLLLLATLVVPSVGLVGLGGVVLANGICLALALDRASVRSGLLGYNALLVFLAIGAFLEHSPVVLLVALAAGLLTVLMHVALTGALRSHFGLPVLSLPFVLVTWVVLAAVPHLKGVALVSHPPAVHLPALPGPLMLDGFFRSLGAIFFQPHWASGVLVLVALGRWSRIAVVHAMVGFGVAWAADAWLLHFPPNFFHVYAGFNVVLTAVALGGVFFVPGPDASLLSVGGSLVAALVTVGSLSILAPLGLPVLALPFNLVALLTLYALRQRSASSRPRSVTGRDARPEDNLAWYRQWAVRFGQKDGPRLVLPFRGAWTVSQGNDGPHTHQSIWRHGLDFEVRGTDGRWCEGTGDQLTDYHCYRLPVVAPAPGTVVRVVDGLPDCAPGTADTIHPWGNLVLLWVGADRYFLLAHLTPGSIRVEEGATVRTGQELARCGASGRAPRPHLHVQLQSTSVVGAPTVPMGFHNLWSPALEGARLERYGVPKEGQQVRNSIIGNLRIDWPIGARTRWRWADGSEPLEVVELVSQLDSSGQPCLLVMGSAACMRFEIRDGIFYALGVDGDHPVLRTLYAALLMVPLDAALDRVGAALTWKDTIDLRVLSSGGWSWLRDIISTVVPPKKHFVDYSACRTPDGLVLEGRSEALQTAAHVDAAGVSRVFLELQGRRMSLTKLGEAP